MCLYRLRHLITPLIGHLLLCAAAAEAIPASLTFSTSLRPATRCPSDAIDSSAIAQAIPSSSSPSPIAENKGELGIHREKLLFLLSGEWVSRALYAATKFEIADHLQNGPESVEELAKLSSADPDSLHRLLHLLAGFELFEEIAPQVFANTEMGVLLAKEHPETLHSLALFYGEDIHHSWDALLPSVQKGSPAFQLVCKQPVFAYTHSS